MYKIGILGGMGPEATNLLFKYIIKYKDVKTDQEHLPLIILNNPSFPDRTKAIIDKDDKLINLFKNELKTFKKLNVKYYCCPCNTAHYFLRKIDDKKPILIDLISTTQNYLLEHHKKDNIIILSTKGTKISNLYTFDNIKTNYTTYQDEIDEVITLIKAQSNKALDKLKLTLQKEKPSKNTIFVLACTELSIYYEELKKLNYNVIDPLILLSKRIIKLVK